MKTALTVAVVCMWLFLAYLHVAEVIAAVLGLAAIAGVLWILDAAGGIDGNDRN